MFRLLHRFWLWPALLGLTALTLLIDEARGEFLRTLVYTPLGWNDPSPPPADDLAERLARAEARGALLEERLAAQARQWQLRTAFRAAAGDLPSLAAELRASPIDARARALRDDREGPEHLLLTAGAGDGVRVGMAVARGDALVGTVIAAGPAVSRVRLLSDPDTRVPVLIEDAAPEAGGATAALSPPDQDGAASRTRPSQHSALSTQHSTAASPPPRLRAILAGDPAQTGALELRWLSREDRDRLRPGLRVWTSGAEGLFPKGLWAGTIETVEAPPGAAFLRVRVRAPVPLVEVEFVEVVGVQE